MRTLSRSLMALAAVASLFAQPAQAQFSLGLAGGATVPSGDLNDRQNLGYNGLVAVQLGMPLMPVQLRADLQYNSFGGRNFNDAFGQARAGTDTRVISGSLNAVVNLLPGPIKPYLIGGVGYYDSRFGGTNAASTRQFGFNGGAGVKFSLIGASIFAEARVHEVRNGTVNVGAGNSQARFIPVMVGVMF
jgi:opacity protein-like surface antigen